MTVTYTVGDTREVIQDIADGSVDFICSSPPFLALRSYVPADHESKGDEIGSERNPAEFIDMLLGLTAEWGRVLAPHGSIAIELGDTYSGSGGAGGDYNEGGLRDGQGKVDGSQARTRQFGFASGDRVERPHGFRRGENVTAPMNGGTGWPRAKSLALIPQLYAVALAYGINPLTGQASPAGRWLVRNVIVWHRPNPAVGALGDKVRPSTSYIVVATRSPKRWFDLTAVRQPLADSPGNRYVRKVSAGDIDGRTNATVGIDRETNKITKAYDPSASAGAPPLDAWFDTYDGTHDTWTLTTQPSRISVKVPTRVPCGPDDGGERTTSPDCPVHGDQAAQVPTARCDEPATSPSSRTSRTDERRDQSPEIVDSHDALTSTRSGQPTATPRNTASSRTAPALSTNQPDTPSARTAVDTAHTPESPELSDDHRDTFANSNGEVCPPADGHETAPRNGHKSDLESACTCTFHLDKYSIHSHYAMWPAKLAERLILSMCPREVCRICGTPRERIECTQAMLDGNPIVGVRHGTIGGQASNTGVNHNRFTTERETTGWTDCYCQCPTCNNTRLIGMYPDIICPDCRDGQTVKYRPGLVLDPFAGSGTTLAVADLHGRDAIGVDFDARNKAIYPARYDEVKRALYGTPAPMPGQGDLFAEVAG